MKKILTIIAIILFSFFITGCINIPNDEVDTPDTNLPTDNPVDDEDKKEEEKPVTRPESAYTGIYYDTLDFGLKAEELKQALRVLVQTTHKYHSTYSDCKFNLPNIDEDPNDPNKMILFYTGESIEKSFDLNNDWNREHVWAKSIGWFKNDGAGSDLHHIRSCNIAVNSARGNMKFGKASGYYEPTDEYKGDVARIIFYLMIAYSEADRYSFNSIAESKEILLEWNKLDPVSELEILRNDKVEDIQGNRNPFIDYPVLADYIWEE
ncbi:MAG: endonuclease [Bacilli bacterium]|nr:endonuclease [Bacilli bacterium]